MTTKTLNILSIRVDGNTQSRVAINNDTVAEYATSVAEGDTFPPVVVFYDGTDYWLADGFHRLFGHKQAGRSSILADVQTGTQRDAVLYSLGANIVHGLRITNEDKRKAVGIMLADAEWSKMTDREIGRQCGCSHMTVGRMRNPEPAATGTSATASKPFKAPGSGTSATAPAAPVVSAQQAQTAKNAEDAHGADADPVVLLEAAHKENAELTARLAAAEEDDQKAATIKWKRIADSAQSRQNELMETVNAREGELKRLMGIIRRIGVAVGEDDPTKLAATVEAFVRNAKVAA